jgi:hypothetical protein
MSSRTSQYSSSDPRVDPLGGGVPGAQSRTCLHSFLPVDAETDQGAS